MTYPMFDPLLDGVFVMGPNKEIYYCNDACASLFDLPRKKITSGSPCYELFTVDDADLFVMPDGTKGERQMNPYKEVEFQSASGKRGLVQIAILPTQELFGRNRLWFVYLHDVTLEASLHKKYRTQIEEKERVIEELSRAKSQTPDPGLHEQLQEIQSSLENLKTCLKHSSPDLKQVWTIIEAITSATGKITKAAS